MIYGVSLASRKVTKSINPLSVSRSLNPSPRRISPEQAQEIASHLPRKIERVGVFVNQSAELIRAVVEQVGLTAVQLHGEETPEFAAALPVRGRRGGRTGVIKTILANDQFESALALSPAPGADLSSNKPDEAAARWMT